MGECVSDEELLKLLRLPESEDGLKQLHKMIMDLGSEFSDSEKVFIILYTNPLSKLCGKMNQCSVKAGKYKSYGNWLLQQPKIKKIVSDLQDKALLDEIKTALTEDARRCMRVLNTNRADFRKDTEFTFTRQDNGEEVTVEKVKDKCLYELTKDQQEAIADFTYDKNGDAHPVIEKRSEARAALQNYQKLYGTNLIEGENKSTETIVTLEGIKDKATAKIQIIQRNNDDAKMAGEFIEKMADVDEEA